LSIGSTVNIAGNPTASLVGKFIRARRTSAAAYTPVKSNILGAVTDASGNTGGSGTGSSNPIDDLLDAIGGAAGGTGGTAGFGAAGNAASKAAQPVREVLDSRERSYADAGLSSGW
ncbi:MAG: hypothetical protein LBH00_03160, partial [Planctomycetaceae bacterium]|jgi:hypothetical protein|nr:hypothetical protein [Planctomycetaceae bacterium]